MYKILIAIISFSAFNSAAFGNEAIIKRQETMQVVRTAMKVLGPMSKGVDYDPFLASTTLESMLEAMKPYSSYFPEGSETGNKTQAATAIWDDKNKFEKLVDSFVSDIEIAIMADLENEDLFKTNFDTISKNCRSCHMSFRTR